MGRTVKEEKVAEHPVMDVKKIQQIDRIPEYKNV